jgi:hypothetical protein
LESHQKRLEAAHLVYYELWGKDLDKLLQPVPDSNNFKYLTKKQIDSLGLRRLGYDEVVLLVRDEYKLAYNDLCSYNKRLKGRRGGVVVTGQPGIGMHFSLTVVSFANNHHPTPNVGKTCFLYYILLRLLSEKQPVAIQLGNTFILFQPTGVLLSDDTDLSGFAIPCGTWTLSDSQTGFEKPCPAFLAACKAGNAWIVQTTSPSRTKWSSWHKERKAVKYWMDVFSLDEMIALG